MAIMDGVPEIPQTTFAASKAVVESAAEPMVLDAKVEPEHNGTNGSNIEQTPIEAPIETNRKADDGDVQMSEFDGPRNGLLDASELVTSAPPMTETTNPSTQIAEPFVARVSEDLTAPTQVEQPVSDVRDEEPLPEVAPQDEDSLAVDQATETSPLESSIDHAPPAPSNFEQPSKIEEPLVLADSNLILEISTSAAAESVDPPVSAPEAAADNAMASPAQDVTFQVATGQVRQRDEDDEAEPSAKRAKITPDAEAAVPSVEYLAPSQSVESVETAAPVESVEPAVAAITSDVVVPPTTDDSTTAVTTAADAVTTENTVTGPPASMPAPELPASGLSEFDKGPLTKSQTRYLLDSVRKAKKIKAAIPFLNPVDAVALNLPTYNDIVKVPMDLSTIEDRLKNEKYPSANALWTEFELMAANALAFNGANHPVTQHGYNLRAYFNKLMQSIPKGDAATSEPVKKAASPKPMLPRRESRHIPVPKPSPAPAPTPKTTPKPVAAKPKVEPKKHEPVLDSNGVPVIRRVSESERPKREIIKPQPKDMPYSHIKPKKKSAQLELKFCDQVVLKEIKKPKHQHFAYPFMQPVDSVALNIPTYHQVIKKPMDFGTIERNLQRGEYNNAKEFAQDARLVFKNCYQFNGPSEPVHLWGKELEALFEELFAQKDEWIAANQPVSEPASDEESEAESSEEESETQEERMRKVAELQKQITALNTQMLELINAPLTKPKKKSKSKSKGDSSKSKKRSSVGAAAPASKSSKPKKAAKPKKLSLEQKRYVSEGIMMLDEVNMRKAVQMIRNGVPKLKDVNDDELELDVDDIPDPVLQTLHKFVKDYRRANGIDVAEDDEYEEPAGDDASGTKQAAGSSSHRKKSKPMSAREQESRIERVKQQLQQFEGGSGDDAGGGVDADGESSEDASSSSEEE